MNFKSNFLFKSIIFYNRDMLCLLTCLLLLFCSIQISAQIFPDPSPNCGNGLSNPSDLGDAPGNVDASTTVTGTTDANGIYTVSTNELCVQGDLDNQLGCGDDPEWLIRIDVRSIMSSLPICEPVNFRVCRRGDFGQVSEVVFVYDENFDEIGSIPGAPQNSTAFDCTESPICTIVSLDPCVFNPQAIADGFFDLTLYTNGNIGGNSVGDFCNLSPGPQADADFTSCTNDAYCPTYTQVVNGNFPNQNNGGPMVTANCDGCNCLFIDYFAVNTGSFADTGFTIDGNGGCDGPITLTPNPTSCGQSWSSPDGGIFSSNSGVATFTANTAGTFTICNNVGLAACQEQACQTVDVGPCCDDFANATELCDYIAANPNSGVASLDCDGGGSINSIECTDGGDPFDDIDDSCDSFAASGEDLCDYLDANPGSPLATADCDGGGVDNITECNAGGNPSDPNDDSCDNFEASGLDLCDYLDANPNSPLATLDCDGGGVDNATECNEGGNPFDPIDDDCDNFAASGQDLCDYLNANPGSPLEALDCDGGGVDNITECNSGGDPDDPNDDSCDNFEASGGDLCAYLDANPGSPLATLDCDGGGVDNATECGAGGNPFDPVDDSCDNFEASGQDLCTYLDNNPGSPLATLDCDGGGVSNEEECTVGGDPFDEADDSCDSFAATGQDLCTYIAANPGTPLAIADCDGGGVDNITECDSGGNPDDPIDDSCDNFEASGQDLCAYLNANPGSPLATLDCDNGGVDNATECGSGGDPFDPVDDSCENFAASGQDLCVYLDANPGSPLSTLDCDNGGVDNATECGSGGDPFNPIDDSCENFEISGQDICAYIQANPNSPLVTADCDDGGVDNATECGSGGDAFDPIDDSCENFEASGEDLCTYIADNPGTPLENEDCDNGGIDNLTECNSGGDPDDPIDDSCDNFEASGQDLCIYLGLNPGSPLATLDCDSGGVDNETECGIGGDPFDPIDDSCENFEASGEDICQYIQDNPGSPMALLDCDDGGVDNETECNNGGDPFFPSDDSCEEANEDFLQICAYLNQNPNSPLATLDCDFGGIDNITECNGGGDPNDPVDDTCDFQADSGTSLCDFLTANPNSPLATLDCDGGGIDNQTECDDGGDPYFAPDDSCEEANDAFLDICAYLTNNPNSPLAILDCDGGGVDNQTECGNGGDPSDPIDDSCDNFEASGEDLCMYIIFNPDSPLVNQDCDGGGVDNLTECNDGGDPFNEDDDSCENFEASGEDLCLFLAADPGNPLATQDCDGGGVDNITECNDGGNPFDPVDDSCENFEASGQDICTYINQNPNSPLSTSDCDEGGVDNMTECNDGGDPFDPADDSCENFETSGQDICVFLGNNPTHPLATVDCDNGGINNITECFDGGDPFDPADDSCENFAVSGQDLCTYIANNPNSPLSTADCDDGGVDNETECNSGGDPSNPSDDSCENFAVSGQDLCAYIKANPGSPLVTADCDDGGVNNEIECNSGGDPSDPVDDSCENFEASGLNLCNYLDQNPGSPLANQDCDNGGVPNQTECDDNDDPFDDSDDCTLVCNDNNECTDDILNEDNCTCTHVFTCANDFTPPVITPGFGNGVNSGDEISMLCDNPEGLDETSVTVVDNCDDSPAITFVDEFIGYGDCNTDGYISKWRCYWVAEDECGNESIFEIFVTLTCPPCNDNNACTNDVYEGCECVHEPIPGCGTVICTYPQIYYGTPGYTYGGYYNYDIIDESFENCGGIITVGLPGQSITVTSTECVTALLPGYGGVAQCQPGNTIYSGLCSYNQPLGNSLAAALIALNLNLNLDYSLGDLSLCNPSGCVYAPQSVRNLIGADGNVYDLIYIANHALGGSYGSNQSLFNDIYITINLVNDGFSYCANPCPYPKNNEDGTSLAGEQQLVNEQFEFTISPNPAEDYIKVVMNLSKDVTDGKVKILQLDGKEIYQENFAGYKGFNQNTFGIHQLPVGIYFIAIEFGDEVHLQKLMKI